MLVTPPYQKIRQEAIRILKEHFGNDADVQPFSYQNATVEEAKEIGRMVGLRPQLMVSSSGPRTVSTDSTGFATTDEVVTEVLVAAQDRRGIQEQSDKAELFAFNVRIALQGRWYQDEYTHAMFGHSDSNPVVTSKALTMYAVTFTSQINVDVEEFEANASPLVNIRLDDAT